MAGFIDKTAKIPLDDKNFRRIIQFYVFECPVEHNNKNRVSQRGETLRELGWESGNCTRLLNLMKNDCPLRFVSQEEMNHTPYGFENYGGVLVQHGALSKTATVFYYIRNAFAHGSFSVEKIKKEILYSFQNDYHKKRRGLFRLREHDLLRWIDICKEGPSYSSRKKRANGKNAKVPVRG